MTQVVTVSAHTAAYASEAVKKPIRSPRKTDVQDNMRAVVNNAAEGEDVWKTAPLNMVQSSKLSLDFLSANQSRHEQQATLKQTIDAYKNSTT
ncbi:hypothetical protein J5J10_06735 [Ciceribacter sp. L1K23]|uniref:hypothetical protein n=1 Tax=unclassified Ciceribacter TaxID=2628820 RepID=UPI001ABDF3DF|nr:MULTISPECIES: hypothetical protein [unclassified Ciceribacter]MBO3760568.1 hypothetical protein [Ciceribacter sp. L1K22]MBR0555373.1 hypothetical protein [Ciceribacter sp. L1K23]